MLTVWKEREKGEAGRRLRADGRGKGCEKNKKSWAKFWGKEELCVPLLLKLVEIGRY